MTPRATLARVLKATALASALATATSATLLLATLALRPIPEAYAWPLAGAIVLTGSAGIAGFAWIVLTLPPGAPWRRTGLRVAVATLGLGFLAPLALHGADAAIVGAVGTAAVAHAWRPRWAPLGWTAAAAAGLAALGGGDLQTLGGAALAGSSILLVREEA